MYVQDQVWVRQTSELASMNSVRVISKVYSHG